MAEFNLSNALFEFLQHKAKMVDSDEAAKLLGIAANIRDVDLTPLNTVFDTVSEWACAYVENYTTMPECQSKFLTDQQRDGLALCHFLRKPLDDFTSGRL